MTVYTCPACSELFHKHYLSGTFPGGKEKEDIDCPACGHTVATEMTSAIIGTKALTAVEKAAHQANAKK